MDADNKLRLVIQRIGDLPAMPDMVSEVIRLTDDPCTDLSQVSNVIQHDPSLAAKILQVSNSPYYGMKQYVGTLKLALVILGVREVRNVVLGITVFDALHHGKTMALLGARFWTHSFLTGALAKRLANHLRLDLQGEAFAAGLLHDLGKLVLLKQMTAAYAPVYKKLAMSSQLLCEAEFREFGFTHADAAMALTKRWNFPKTLTDAIWCHHPVQERPIASAKDPQLAAIVRLSNIAAQPDLNDALLAQLEADAEAWEQLEPTPSPIAPAQRRSTIAQFVEEMKQNPLPAFYK